MPLIVTDSNGEEPMVVLSLEQFDAMSSAGSDISQPEKKGRSMKREPNVESRIEEIRHEMPSASPSHFDEKEVIFEDVSFAKNEHLFENEAQIHSVDFPIDASENADFDAPLEEQFFLEPLDDEENG